ncbi:hypothetical protein DICA1_A06106 [Diutina catenulata]
MAHVPKFIKETRWYNQQEERVFKAEGDASIDRGDAELGAGIQDGVKPADRWDEARDQWFGYTVDEWEQQLKNWRSRPATDDADDSDDTDYELELIELGLSQHDIKKTGRNHPWEQSMRDRSDIAGYIHNISANANGKIELEYDPRTRTMVGASGLTHASGTFVKGSGAPEKMSWEIGAGVEPSSETNTPGPEPEAETTMDQMLARVNKRQQQRAEKQQAKRQKLHQKPPV